LVEKFRSTELVCTALLKRLASTSSHHNRVSEHIGLSCNTCLNVNGSSLKNPDRFSCQLGHFKAEDISDSSDDSIIEYQNKSRANIQSFLPCWVLSQVG